MMKFVLSLLSGFFAVGALAFDAAWIGAPGANDPAFEKTFELTNRLERAVLKVTGVGFYEFSINGRKVGRKVLDPTPTDYTKRICYSVYDVTDMLRPGKNGLRLLLGNGWYNVRSVAAWNFNRAPWRGEPRGIAELALDFRDGSKGRIATDGSWRLVRSPVAFNDFREGEVVRSQAPEDGSVRNAVLMPAPGGRLVEAKHPGAEIVREYRPVKVERLGDDAFIYDFGVNLAGWARIRFGGLAKGAVVSVRYDERHPSEGKLRHIDVHVRKVASPSFDLGIDPKTAGFQTDRFVSAGLDAEVYEPRFTYNGFRYVIVKGCRTPPALDEVVGCFIRTAFPKTGSFVCDNVIFNKLVAATELAYEGNFTDGFPTDCPHREKNGWLGDAATAIEFALYSYASDANTATYANWLQTIADQQTEDGRIPSIVPTSGWGMNKYSCGGGPAWGIAFTTIPYALYRFRGETDVMEKLYPSMRLYADKLISELSPLCCHGFGDWVAVKLNKPGDLFSCRTAPRFTSTAYAYRTLVEMAAMAEVLGRADDAARFARRANRLREDFNRAFYRGNGVYENGFACGQAMALMFGLAPENEVAAVSKRLVCAVHEEGDKIDFGLLGSTVVFRALSEAGETDLALKMIMNETYPGFAHWIKSGATTLWESWKGGSSRNHVMFGDFAAWAYAYVAGVRPLEPGFRKFEVQPRPPSALSFVRAIVPTPHGEIKVGWKKADGKLGMEIVVPAGTEAEAVLPSGRRCRLHPGKHQLKEK